MDITIKLGDPYKFIPEIYESGTEKESNGKYKRKQVTGTVCYINAAHRYFTVEWPVRKGTLRESFKF